MSWLYLGLAIAFELAGTICMKLSEGFTRVWPTIFIFVFYMICFSFFTLAIRRLDIGMSYAIWAGVGTAAVAVVGFIYFHEVFSYSKLFCIGLIIVGVVGLRLSG